MEVQKFLSNCKIQRDKDNFEDFKVEDEFEGVLCDEKFKSLVNSRIIIPKGRVCCYVSTPRIDDNLLHHYKNYCEEKRGYLDFDNWNIENPNDQARYGH